MFWRALAHLLLMVLVASAPAVSRAAPGGDREFEGRFRALVKDREDARKLRDSDPRAYVDAVKAYIVAVEKLTLAYPPSPQEASSIELTMGSNYLDLGHFVRFRLKQPMEALDLYAAAVRRRQAIAALAIADTYQFDLQDKQRASEEYRKAVMPRPTAEEFENGGFYSEWGQRWLKAQIAYLDTGKTFSGALDTTDLKISEFLKPRAGRDDDFALAGLAAKVGQMTMQPGADRSEVVQELRKAASSNFVLNASVWYISFLPTADSVLEYLARQDPAGYASACYFAWIDLIDRGSDLGRLMLAPGMRRTPGPDPLREAKARFFTEHRIDTKSLHDLIDAQERGKKP